MPPQPKDLYEKLLWKARKPLHYNRSRAENLKFIICGTARSGTGYLAKLIDTLGYPCGHEEIFGFPYTLKDRNLVGESSWLALPAFSEIPNNIILLHPVRHPIKTIQSNIRKGLFMTKVQGKKILNVYGRFAMRNMELKDFEDNLNIYMRYWTQWNLMIEEAGKYRPYFRYRLEDINIKKNGLLEEILFQQLHLEKNINVTEALKAVPNNFNTTTRLRNLKISLKDLPKGPNLEALRKLAENYGYELVDS